MTCSAVTLKLWLFERAKLRNRELRKRAGAVVP